MTPSVRAFAVCACLPFVSACHSMAASTLEAEAAVAVPAEASFPRDLVVAAGDGPALFTGSESNAPAFAYVSEGTPVRVVGAPIDGRIPVRIEGPLTLRGYLPTSRLAARVLRRVRVSGTPTSAGPGDLVLLVGAEPDGRLRVVVTPRIEGAEASQLTSYEGTIPRDAIEGAEPPAPEAERLASIEAGIPIVLYTRPGGEVLVTLPVTNAPVRASVAREEGAFHAVRLGEGPNLIGWTDAPLGAALPAPPAAAPCAPNTPPARLRGGQIARVREGARIRLGGRAFGIAETSLYAQVIERLAATNEVDVFVAGNDSAAMRGLVRAEDLE
jgi:hypothetical protein